MPDIHLKFGPSSSHRWTVCTKSLPPDDHDRGHAGKAALEGTAAHALCEKYFPNQDDLQDSLGEVIEGVVVTQAMINGAELYYSAIDDVSKQVGGSHTVELERFERSDWCDEFGGTMDCVIKGVGFTAVLDYKYGLNPVEAKGNTQLLSYLSLVAEPGDLMLGVIVQPRWSHPDGCVRAQVFSDADMQAFMRKATTAVRLIENGAAEYVTGGHCRYCPMIATCPALANDLDASLSTDPGDMTPVQIADILSKKKVYEDFLDKVKQVAVDKLESDDIIPGYKLVETYGRRKWKVDDEVLKEMLVSEGFSAEDIIDGRMKSPAQMEKVVGKAIVSKLATLEVSGTTVAPEDDKRPGRDLNAIRREFNES